MIWLRTIDGVKRHFSTRWSEWLMLFPAIGISAVLWLQPNMFDLAPHYSKLREWGEESTWEVLILVAAVFRLCALVINGTYSWFRYAPHFRLAASIMAGALWAQFSLSALIVWYVSAHQVTSLIPVETSLGPVVSYGALALIEGANVFRSSRDVGAWARSLET